MEDKFDDEQEMRDRARLLVMQGNDGQERPSYESQDINEELMVLAKQHGELNELITELVQRCVQLLKRNISMCVSSNDLSVKDILLTWVSKSGQGKHIYHAWQACRTSYCV